MVPETVLETCRKAYGKAPLAFALAVRGDKFEMGEGLSSAAKQNMKEAEKFLSELLQTGRPNSLLHRGGRLLKPYIPYLFISTVENIFK